MREDLKKFMLRLAGDVELLTRFTTSPWETGEAEGLPREDLELLFSGNQQQIYLALIDPPPQPPQQQAAPPPPPAGNYAWAWTPWGWQLYSW